MQGHGGDFLYRWGDVANYGGTGAETLFQQHNAQWIAAGLPGAGDILIFNDGDNRTPVKYSSVDEITPPVTSTGGYTLGTNGTFGPTSDTWEWQDSPVANFYNADVGGCQRLPNGDTLICYGQKGLAFEVTPAGAIDWEYQCPDDGLAAGSGGNDGRLFQGDSLPADPNNVGGFTTSMFRAPWYSPAYLAATGQTLTTSGTIEFYRDSFTLYNPGTSAVSLGGMYLTTSASDPTMYEIPSADDVSIAAGGSVVFYADGQTSDTTAAGRHTSFTLSSSGGSVYLYNTDGVTLLASETYPALAANVSCVAASLSFSGASVVGAYGGTATLAVTLSDGGLAISNKTVRFGIDGSTVGTATTNSSGMATLAGVGLAGLQAGTYPGYVTAAFAGDGMDAATSAATNLVVSQLTWSAGANGTWTSSSWTGAPTTYPGSTADAVINTPYTVTVSSKQYAYSLEVSGNGQVSIGSGGTLSVGAGATVSSGSAIDLLSGAILALSGLNSGTGTGSVYLNGGTLQAGGAFTTAVPVSLGSGGGTVNTNGSNMTLSAAISGAGKFSKSGAGTLTLSGTNTYSGGTVVNAGTLVATASAALPAGGSLIVGAGGTFIFDPTVDATSSAVVAAAPEDTAVAVPVATSATSDDATCALSDNAGTACNATSAAQPVGMAPSMPADATSASTAHAKILVASSPAKVNAAERPVPWIIWSPQTPPGALPQSVGSKDRLIQWLTPVVGNDPVSYLAVPTSPPLAARDAVFGAGIGPPARLPSSSNSGTTLSALAAKIMGEAADLAFARLMHTSPDLSGGLR